MALPMSRHSFMYQQKWIINMCACPQKNERAHERQRQTEGDRDRETERQKETEGDRGRQRETERDRERLERIISHKILCALQ